MSDEELTPERILEATENVLRRFGPAKATVVDVARALGVSHGSVYRYFPSKAVLRDKVTERWLARMSAPLDEALQEQAPALQRLRHWFDLLLSTKRQSLQDDPELFAMYLILSNDTREVVQDHVDDLIKQVTMIIIDGVASGEFTVKDPVKTGRAVFYAMSRFHNPVHVSEWSDPEIDTSFEEIWLLILYGLGVHVSEDEGK